MPAGSLLTGKDHDSLKMNLVTILKGKIHRATITDSDPDYEGSITLDPQLMAAAGIIEYEKILVADITNGNRLETYVIAGREGTGQVGINGAATQLINLGDLVILLTFRAVPAEDVSNYPPKIILVDEQNRILDSGKE